MTINRLSKTALLVADAYIAEYNGTKQLSICQSQSGKCKEDKATVAAFKQRVYNALVLTPNKMFNTEYLKEVIANKYTTEEFLRHYISYHVLNYMFPHDWMPVKEVEDGCSQASLLQDLDGIEHTVVFRTVYGEAPNDVLPRVRVFITTDVRFHEGWSEFSFTDFCSKYRSSMGSLTT